MIRLNYVFGQGEVVTWTIKIDSDWFSDWLHLVVRENPNCIFFYTVDSTDVWDAF